MARNTKQSNDINSVLQKQEKKNRKNGIKWNLSLVSIILLVFVAYLTFGVIINSAKIYSLNAQVIKLNKINKIATKKNQYLREELEKYTSNSGVEALARNRLQFSKEDETLIIIKRNQDEDNQE